MIQPKDCRRILTVWVKNSKELSMALSLKSSLSKLLYDECWKLSKGEQEYLDTYGDDFIHHQGALDLIKISSELGKKLGGNFWKNFAGGCFWFDGRALLNVGKRHVLDDMDHTFWKDLFNINIPSTTPAPYLCEVSDIVDKKFSHGEHKEFCKKFTGMASGLFDICGVLGDKMYIIAETLFDPGMNITLLKENNLELYKIYNGAII